MAAELENRPTPQVFLPTAEQETLLRACLGCDDAAIDAWQSWRERVDFDDLDPGSQRLVPLLYRNLVRLGRDPQELGRYRGIYRKAWYENQLHLRDLARLLDALRAAGVACLLLKGIPLALAYYEEVALRPMADIDLLVRPEDAQRAARALTDLGYRPESAAASDLSQGFVETVNAAAYKADDRSSVDLHWRVFLECWQQDAELRFWDSAQTLECAGQQFRTMCPEDLLLHVCVHGVAWDRTPPLRWIADAATILRTCGDAFDWTGAVRRARDLGLVLPFREALAYLAIVVPDQLPHGQPRQMLASMRPTRRERIMHRVAVSSPASLGWGEPFWFYYVRHFGPRAAADGWWAAIRSFPRFLQVAWGLPRMGDVPSEASRKLRRRWARQRPERAGL